VHQVLAAILSDFVYERCVVTLEQKTNHPRLYADIKSMIDRCPIETLPYPQFMLEFTVKPKFFVRTGAFEPWVTSRCAQEWTHRAGSSKRRESMFQNTTSTE